MPAAAESHDTIPIEALDYSGQNRAPCVKCGTAMVAGTPACPKCGYDPASVPLNPDKAREILGEFDPDVTPVSKRKKKPKKIAPAPPPPTCSQCSYPIAGLTAEPNGSVTCPECGTRQVIRVRRAVDDETSRDVERWMYLKPSLVLAGFFVMLVLTLLVQGWVQGGLNGALSGWIRPSTSRGWGVAARAVAHGLAWYGCGVVVGFGVALLLTTFWCGGSTTKRVLALQIASLMTMAFGVTTAVLLIPIPIPLWAVLAVVGIFYTYYLADWQDLYMQDAGIIAGVTVVAMWIVRIAWNILL